MRLFSKDVSVGQDRIILRSTRSPSRRKLPEASAMTTCIQEESNPTKVYRHYSIVVNVLLYSLMSTCLPSLRTMPAREFMDVQQRLEDVLLQLKATTDPNVRRPLLREMRHLLGEAERLSFNPPIDLSRPKYAER